ncbi:MAG: cytochrome c-type biogenesis protein, partial [Gammaproteobacteria bacterium]
MRIALLSLLLVFSLGAAAQDPAQFDDPAHEARYRQLVSELRCLVCQNQTLAESNAPLAVDLRAQVRARLQAGASDAEIIDYLTARYGEFVLYRPRFTASTALLWLAPGLLLLGGGVAAWRLIRTPASDPMIGDAERASVRA